MRSNSRIGSINNVNKGDLKMSDDNIKMLEQMVIIADNTLTQAENNLMIVVASVVALFLVIKLIKKFL